MKQISVGRESFAKFIENDNYYVDKTLSIKEIFKNNQGDVLLITRPRRFGKTLSMSTFHEFLRINPSNPDNPEDISYQERLFKDTKIFEDKEFCHEYMGKFPVIFITLKDVAGDTYELAFRQMARVIVTLVNDNFSYLLTSEMLSDSDKRNLLKISDMFYFTKGWFRLSADDEKYEDRNVDGPDDILECMQSSLNVLTACLFKHHGANPILLIDEYDVPISKAAHFGYYDKMVNLMRGLLSQALKTNKHLGRAVLTGCLKVAKESIFTGLNNLDISSILDKGTPELSKGIGFTKEETQQVLEYCGLEKYSDLVTEHYDGYYFGREHMYCPWDVMNFCKKNYRNVGICEEDIAADNYWINSSGNDVIEEYMGYIDSDHVDMMQTLVDGGSIKSVIRPSLCYGDLKNHRIEDFWTLLLFTGYLTFNPRHAQSKSDEHELYIPNKEIRGCFEEKIQNYFKENPVMQSCSADLAKGLFKGDAESVQLNINRLLAKYVSIRDFATSAPKENYYHGFMNGVLTTAAALIEEQGSNLESGNGYVDLIAKSKTNQSIAIIEIKQTNDGDDDKGCIAGKALEQIKERKYADKWVKRSDIKSVYIFGICFCKKACFVMSEQLK